jgi:hypothetical protein
MSASPEILDIPSEDVIAPLDSTPLDGNPVPIRKIGIHPRVHEAPAEAAESFEEQKAALIAYFDALPKGGRVRSFGLKGIHDNLQAARDASHIRDIILDWHEEAGLTPEEAAGANELFGTKPAEEVHDAEFVDNEPTAPAGERIISDGELIQLSGEVLRDSQDVDSFINYTDRITNPLFREDQFIDACRYLIDLGEYEKAVKIAQKIESQALREGFLDTITQYQEQDASIAAPENPPVPPASQAPQPEGLDAIDPLAPPAVPLVEIGAASPSELLIEPEFGPQTKEDFEREANAELAEARSEYAAQLTEFRKKQSKTRKLLAQLGVMDKQTPESEWPAELAQASERYSHAKREKARAAALVIKNINIPTQPDVNGVMETEMVQEYALDKEKLLALAEEEDSAFKGEIADLAPEQTKAGRIAAKGMEWLGKRSPATKIAASTLVLTGTGFALGSFGVAGAVMYGGYRATRAAVGAVAGQVVGKKVGNVQQKNNVDREEKIKDDFGNGINLDNYELKEKERMQNLEKHENLKKRQVLYKAGAMVATGAGTSIGLGIGQMHFAPTLQTDAGIWSSMKKGLGLKSVEAAARPVPGVGEKPVGSALDAKVPAPPVIPEGPKLVDTNVELSSKGFISTFDDMKAKLIAQYGEGNVPKQYAHFVNTPSEKLAQEFGFYDPEKHLSAMGIKGETLELNKSGDLIYTDKEGIRTGIFDAKTGNHTQWGGKMFNPDEHPKAAVAESEAEPDAENSVMESPKPATAVSEQEFDPNQPLDASADVPESSTLVPDENTYEPGGTMVYDSASPGHIPAAGAADSFPSETSMGAEPEFGTQAPQVAIPHPGEPFLSDMPRMPITAQSIELPHGLHAHLEGPVGQHTLNLDGIGPIAHEHAFGTGKILTLDDKFQDGAQFKDIRSAFAVAFDKTVDLGKLGKTAFPPVPFEGGKIHVLHGIGDNPHAVKVFLNGKEIASGVDDVGSKVNLVKGLKGSFLLPDNAYERALKHVGSVLKALKKQAH